MEKMKLVNHAREMETLFSAYLEIIYGTREDTSRIISSLEAVVANIDRLTAAASASHSPREDKEDLELLAEKARTLALMALSAANHTFAMIQRNLPQAQEGLVRTTELVRKLTQGQGDAQEGYDSFYQALTEIKQVVRQVKEDAAKCVAAARVLLPQVENLQNRMLALLPRAPEDDGRKRKKIGPRSKPGVSLHIIDGGH